MQQISEIVAPVIELTATRRFEILGARNLAVAAIENAIELEREQPGNHAHVIAVCQKDRADQRQRENRESPCARRHRGFQEHATNRPGDRAIKKTRNQTILRLSAAAQEPLFTSGDLGGIFQVVPAFGRAGSFPGRANFIGELSEVLRQVFGTFFDSVSSRIERAVPMEKNPRAEQEIDGCQRRRGEFDGQ